MDPDPDPYQVLGVPNDASIADIKRNFRKLVLRYHPDKFNDEESREKHRDLYHRTVVAYGRVGNEDERQAYDRSLKLQSLRESTERQRAEREDREERQPAGRRERRGNSPWRFQDFTAATVYTPTEYTSRTSYYSPRYAPPPPSSRPVPTQDPNPRYSSKNPPPYIGDNNLRERPRDASPRRFSVDVGNHRSYPPPSLKRRSNATKATEEDARRAGIPAGYSYKNWEPTEEPITLLGRVFDSKSLGNSINGRTASKTRHNVVSSEEMTTIYEIPIVSSHWRNGDSEQLQIDALGDYCAKFNFIKEEYAARLGLSVNRENTQSIRIGSGKKIITIGTTSLPSFRFKDERELHSPVFHVLPKCLHDVILGRSFLKMTQTFSALANFTRRVKERVLHGFAHHFLYLGDSMPRFSGLINGKPWEALADSGAKVPVMGEAFAQKSGFNIARQRRYRTTLRFADGSTAETSGMVHGVQWEFGPGGGEKHVLDFHVLRNAPTDVILSDRFLFGTHAFSRYDCYLVDDEEAEDGAYFFAIDYDKRRRAQADAQTIELNLRGEKDDHISALPLQEQAAARAIENDRRTEWDRNFARLQSQSAATGSSATNTGTLPTAATASSPQPTSASSPQKSSQWRRLMAKLTK